MRKIGSSTDLLHLYASDKDLTNNLSKPTQPILSPKLLFLLSLVNKFFWLLYKIIWLNSLNKNILHNFLYLFQALVFKTNPKNLWHFQWIAWYLNKYFTSNVCHIISICSCFFDFIGWILHPFLFHIQTCIYILIIKYA